MRDSKKAKLGIRIHKSNIYTVCDQNIVDYPHL